MVGFSLLQRAGRHGSSATARPNKAYAQFAGVLDKLTHKAKAFGQPDRAGPPADFSRAILLPGDSGKFRISRTIAAILPDEAKILRRGAGIANNFAYVCLRTEQPAGHV